MREVSIGSSTTSLHFVEPDSHWRAELARIGAALGCHCEIYADYAELATYPPRTGIIFVRDNSALGDVGYALKSFLEFGIWLPVIAMDTKPDEGRVVEAIKHGAMDYLELPLREDALASCLDRVGKEAIVISEKRRRQIFARQQLAGLSPREIEVLEGIVDGGSNKHIARLLNISPRTVEIHRANMMGKLGVKHPAEAIRLRIESQDEQIGLSLPMAA